MTITSHSYVFDQCSKNPRQNGHCMHTSTNTTTGGTYITAKCCWCGKADTQRMDHPEHGRHAS